MAKEICASRSSARTLCALQGLIRRKSAQFEASVVSTNWRCKAARVCSLSQTSEASQRSRKCWRCGSERDSINGSRKAHNFGELCTIFVGIGRCSCWNKVSCEFTAYSGDALCGKRQPTSFESANSKSLTEKVKKAAKMAGFSRLFSPMSSFLILGQPLTESLTDRRLAKLGVVFHRPTNFHFTNSHPISRSIPTPRAEVHPDLQ